MLSACTFLIVSSTLALYLPAVSAGSLLEEALPLVFISLAILCRISSTCFACRFRSSRRAALSPSLSEVNPDGTTRDFVDYDANLIAIAHGVADANRSQRIFDRIDSGRCSAASGTC